MHPEISYDENTGTLTNKRPLGPLPETSVYELLLGQTSFEDNTIAFIEHRMTKDHNDRERRQISHGRLKSLAQQLGLGLLNYGKLRKGDMVMLLAPNSIDWVLVALAAQFAGLKLALASPAYSAKELRHVYHLAQPQKVFIASKLLLNATKARIPWTSLISIDIDLGLPGTSFIQKLMATEENARNCSSIQPANLNEVAFLPFSSGTTGLPKGVEITHQNIVSMIQIIFAASDDYTKSKRILTCLPFFHAMALLLHVSLPIATRSTVSIQSPFDPGMFLKIIKDEEVQQLSLVPPIIALFSNHALASHDTFKSVESVGCGAAPLDAGSQKRFSERIGTEVRQGWGMTETTVGCLGLHGNMTPGTCGRIMPGIEAKLIDPETNAVVKLGQRGELWVRGPNIMKGYYRNKEATGSIKTIDGWLKTGDVAIVSEEGDFKIVDRIKELIKYKGSQIAPAELEGLLISHHKVASAGVVGVYSARQATELPRAYIQLRANVSEHGVVEEILDYVRKNAGHTKWLRGGVSIVATVPATPSGKILRKELRSKAQQEWDEETSKL